MCDQETTCFRFTSGALFEDANFRAPPPATQSACGWRGGDPTSYTSPQADCSAQLHRGVTGSDFTRLPLSAEKEVETRHGRVKRACPRTLAVRVSRPGLGRTSLTRAARAPRAGGPPRPAPAACTHPLVDVLPAGLILLLHTLLQEVDAQLEAEVLLLQVIEVLGQSAISIRHGGHPWGGACPVTPSPLHRGAAGTLRRLRPHGPGWLARPPGLRTRLAALGAAAQRTFFFYLREVFAEFLTEEHAA